MGNIYRRKDSACWWLDYRDAAGKRCMRSSKTSDEKRARQLLATIELVVARERAHGVGVVDVMTVADYATKWIAGRRERGVASARDDEARLRHILPHLGGVALAQVRHDHVRDAMAAVRMGGKLAPRTVRHVYAVLHTMFEDAVVERLLPETPCTLRERRDELPPVQDADPRWRDSAVFSREEVAVLLSDKRIPEERRVLYGLAFLAGLRFGELSALTWADWDAAAQPLGGLWVTKAFDHRKLEVKDSTKTDTPRRVPVHPHLALMLAAWRGAGWARSCGRPPAPADLIVPAPTGIHQRPQHALRRLHQDCLKVELRPRRMHDARRTFISLAVADGARQDLLPWVTHGRRPGVMAAYTTPPWDALCREVARLQVGDSPAATLQGPHLTAGELLVTPATNIASTELRP